MLKYFNILYFVNIFLFISALAQKSLFRKNFINIHSLLPTTPRFLFDLIKKNPIKMVEIDLLL